MPQPYPSATVVVYPSSFVNATHWVANFLCKGCSQWNGGSLNPQGSNALAWAMSPRAVATPANANSTIGIHSAKDHFSFDLSEAALPAAEFAALVADIA